MRRMAGRVAGPWFGGDRGEGTFWTDVGRVARIIPDIINLNLSRCGNLGAMFYHVSEFSLYGPGRGTEVVMADGCENDLRMVTSVSG